MEAPEQKRPAPAPPPNAPPFNKRRGFVIAGLVLAAGLFWYAFHSSADAPWNNRAIQAKFTDLVVQRPQKDVQPVDATADPDAQKPETDVHVVLRYVLTNNTGKSYQMPPPSHGALMKNLNRFGLQEEDSVIWESPVIPAGKTANVEFDLTLKPESEDLSGDQLQTHENLVDFCNRQLGEIQSLVFFDYAHRYAIDLPRGWD